jgi:hypothetical protein
VLTDGQASATNEGIVQDFVDALCDASRHIDECAIDIELYPTDDTKRKVANLYAEIFSLLADVSKWVMMKKRKRLIAAFNEDLRVDFEAKVNTINEKSLQVKNHAAQMGRVDVRVTRLTAEHHSTQLQTLDQNVAQNFQTLDQNVEQKFEALGQKFDQMRSEMRQGKQLMGRLLIGLKDRSGASLASHRIQELDCQLSDVQIPTISASVALPASAGAGECI